MNVVSFRPPTPPVLPDPPSTRRDKPATQPTPPAAASASRHDAPKRQLTSTHVNVWFNSPDQVQMYYEDARQGNVWLPFGQWDSTWPGINELDLDPGKTGPHGGTRFKVYNKTTGQTFIVDKSNATFTTLPDGRTRIEIEDRPGSKTPGADIVMLLEPKYQVVKQQPAKPKAPVHGRKLFQQLDPLPLADMVHIAQAIEAGHQAPEELTDYLTARQQQLQTAARNGQIPLPAGMTPQIAATRIGALFQQIHLILGRIPPQSHVQAMQALAHQYLTWQAFVAHNLGQTMYEAHYALSSMLGPLTMDFGPPIDAHVRVELLNIAALADGVSRSGLLDPNRLDANTREGLQAALLAISQGALERRYRGPLPGTLSQLVDFLRRNALGQNGVGFRDSVIGLFGPAPAGGESAIQANTRRALRDLANPGNATQAGLTARFTGWGLVARAAAEPKPDDTGGPPPQGTVASKIVTSGSTGPRAAYLTQDGDLYVNIRGVWLKVDSPSGSAWKPLAALHLGAAGYLPRVGIISLAQMKGARKVLQMFKDGFDIQGVFDHFKVPDKISGPKRHDYISAFVHIALQFLNADNISIHGMAEKLSKLGKSAYTKHNPSAEVKALVESLAMALRLRKTLDRRVDPDLKGGLDYSAALKTIKAAGLPSHYATALETGQIYPGAPSAFGGHEKDNISWMKAALGAMLITLFQPTSAPKQGPKSMG